MSKDHDFFDQATIVDQHDEDVENGTSSVARIPTHVNHNIEISHTLYSWWETNTWKDWHQGRWLWMGHCSCRMSYSSCRRRNFSGMVNLMTKNHPRQMKYGSLLFLRGGERWTILVRQRDPDHCCCLMIRCHARLLWTTWFSKGDRTAFFCWHHCKHMFKLLRPGGTVDACFVTHPSRSIYCSDLMRAWFGRCKLG